MRRIFVVLCLAIGSSSWPLAAGAAEDLDLTAVASAVVRHTNEFRRSEGRQVVAEQAELTEAAQYFADYMARHDKYGHHADGQRPADRAAEHGYEYCLVAENIAYRYSSASFTGEELARRFVEGWKNSPGHRRNMLDADVTETGVAVARSDKSGYYYAVQMFGRPKSLSIEFEIANRSQSTVEYEIDDRTFSLPPRYSRTHERCRPTEVAFRTEDKEEIDSVKPQRGELLTIVDGDSDNLSLLRETMRPSK
jgi:uncharacterized protein YkwD